MSCVALEQLAAVATGEEVPGVLDHARACARCSALVDEQRSIHQLARTLRPPRLPTDRRAELAAEVMALAEAPRRHSWLAKRENRRFAIAGAVGLAVAAALLIVATWSRSDERLPIAPIAHDVPGIRIQDRAAATEPPPAGDPSASIVAASDADLVRDTTPDRDVVTLRAGSVSIDASRTRPVHVVAGTTRVAVVRARAAIVARAGVIEQVSVFAGSVEVMTNGKRHVIEAGATWDRLPQPAQLLQPSRPTASLDAFRQGWTALRNGDHVIAITAFDRATDPVVAEDATYWAAVASERLGQRDDARRRFTDFVARFPASPRADAARTAITRLR